MGMVIIIIILMIINLKNKIMFIIQFYSIWIVVLSHQK